MKTSKMAVLVVLFTLMISASVCAQGLLDLLGTIAGSPPGSKEKYRVTFVDGDRDAEDEILLIRINGIIQEEEEKNEFFPMDMRAGMMETMRKDLETAAGRTKIKAVLLEIDSPGGEVTASDIIHHRLMKFKEIAKKPVFALIKMLGASGAYYVACAADQIYAHPTTIIGSIGVLMQTANVEKLADMIGYKNVILKSERTPKKDLMSPFREMTEEERAMMLTLVNTMYDRFVKIVADGRKKKVEEIVPLADGSVYSADQALAKGLIDGIGYQDDLIEKIQKQLELKTICLVKRRTKKGFAEFMAEMAESRLAVPPLHLQLERFLEKLDTTKFLFQWKPGK